MESLNTDMQDGAASVAAQIEEAKSMIDMHEAGFKQHKDAIEGLETSMKLKMTEMSNAVASAGEDMNAQQIVAQDLQGRIAEFTGGQQQLVVDLRSFLRTSERDNLRRSIRSGKEIQGVSIR